MRDAFLAVDTRGCVADLNPAAARLLGVDPGRTLGGPAAGLLQAWPDLQRHLAEPADGEAELEHSEAGQSRRYYVQFNALRDPLGKALGVQFVWQDITAARAAVDALAARERLHQDLLAVARAALQGPGLGATLRDCLEVVRGVTGAERGSLCLLDERGQLADGIYTALAAGAPPAARLAFFEAGPVALSAWVAQRKLATIVPDLATDSHWVGCAEAVQPMRSALVVPILDGESVSGVVALWHSRPGYFRVDHQRFLHAAGEPIALALRNARLFGERQRLVTRQRILNEVLEAVAGKLDLEATLRAAVSSIARLTSFRNVTLGVPDDSDGGLVLWGLEAAGLPARLEAGRGIMGRAFLTGETQVVPDVAADPDYLALGTATRSELAVPLRRGVRVLGVLNLESEVLAGIGPDEVAFGEALAGAVTLALDNARLYRDLAQGHDRLQALVLASHDGILLLGRWSVIQVINQTALAMLGLAGQVHDWVGRPLEELVEALGIAAAAMAAAQAEIELAEGGHSGPAEGEFVAGARIVHWFNLPVRGAGRLVVLRDVTAERRAAELRDDLTRAMVHDLRNPLVAILGAVALIAESASALPENRRDLVDMARRNAERMRRMVEGILDVSRLESGAVPLQCRPTPLDSLVRDALEPQRVLAAQRGQRIETEVPEDLPCVHVDAELIGRVLQNLVGNSVKFAGAGGRIQVRAFASEASVHVEVADDGPGLPPQLDGRLFRKFAAGPQRERGSGLGLAFCKLAVEAHGGCIQVESAPAQGTRVTFTLPTGQPPQR